MIDFENASFVNMHNFSMFLKVLVQVVAIIVLNQEFVTLLLLECSNLVKEAALGQVHTLLYLLMSHALVWLANVRRLY